MKESKKSPSRRKFIQQTTLAGAGLLLASPSELFHKQKIQKESEVKSKGYAGKDENGKLELWSFERRPVGDNYILIDIKYSGICHSDIHTIKGHSISTLQNRNTEF